MTDTPTSRTPVKVQPWPACFASPSVKSARSLSLITGGSPPQLTATRAHAVPGIPPAYNQIIPAWVLSSNLFAVCRNDEKFRDRDRTVRTRSRHIPVIREETVGLMIRALDLLKVDRVREVYTDREIPGLGKNFLTEEHRTAARESYTFHTGLYALEALDEKGIQAEENPLAGRILGDRFADESPDRLLEIRRIMRERVKADLEQSRSRDHVRGSCIIGDYLSVRGITL